MHAQQVPLTRLGFEPDWPAPSHVRAYMTTRSGGVSLAPWDSLNLGEHVGDNTEHVSRNRALLAQATGAQAVYLKQVHGWQVAPLNAHTVQGAQADVCWTRDRTVACTMMVADCLPILVCHPQASWVAAAHAGWRGLAGDGARGVVEVLAETAQSQGLRVADCLVWLGPCIGPEAFEVGADVQTAFCSATANASLEACFRPKSVGKFQADLAHLARLRLAEVGFEKIYGNDSSPPWCTVSQPSRYFSHRRDAARLGGTTGRMAAGVWLV